VCSRRAHTPGRRHRHRSVVVDIDDSIIEVHGYSKQDSAFYGHPSIGAALTAGAAVSVTVRLAFTVKRVIESIEYTNALYDDETGGWISRAEVAEIPFTAFASQKKTHQIPGRLVVRRIPDLRPTTEQGQGALFDVWRFHAFFTTTDPDDLTTVAADKTHRQYAVIEQVHADLKNSALAHLPSISFSANAAWLVCAVMAFNLTRPPRPSLATPS